MTMSHAKGKEGYTWRGAAPKSRALSRPRSTARPRGRSQSQVTMKSMATNCSIGTGTMWTLTLQRRLVTMWSLTIQRRQVTMAPLTTMRQRTTSTICRWSEPLCMHVLYTYMVVVHQMHYTAQLAVNCDRTMSQVESQRLFRTTFG